MPPREPPDAEAISRSIAEPQAFVIVFEQHFEDVERFVRSRVGPGMGDDLTAETFARAFRARGTYRAERSSALPWLLGIATRVVAEHRRAERRRLRTLAKLVGAEPGRPALGEPGVPGVSPDVVDALRRLPPGERDALLLLAWADLTYEQVAEALDVPVGTVRSRIARARARLSASLVSFRAAVIPGEVNV